MYRIVCVNLATGSCGCTSYSTLREAHINLAIMRADKPTQAREILLHDQSGRCVAVYRDGENENID